MKNQCQAQDLLLVKNVSARFGGVRAVHNVSLCLKEGELIGLIGPNGAGKSTLLNLVSGSIQPSEGEIFFKGRPITGLAPDRLSRLGISRTFQNIRLFPRMSAFENVALGLHSVPRYSLLEAFIRSPRARACHKKLREEALALLELVGLGLYADKRAGDMSYGLQRKLELARAMATHPRLLLLDEPAAGMNEDECDELTALIRDIYGKFGYSVILIEHHIKVVMELCRDSTIYVLNLGELLASGSPAEIQENQSVITAYLGEKRTRHETH